MKNSSISVNCETLTTLQLMLKRDIVGDRYMPQPLTAAEICRRLPLEVRGRHDTHVARDLASNGSLQV